MNLNYHNTWRKLFCLVIGQFIHAPKYSHMNSAMKVVRHIKNNLGLGLLLSSASKIEIKAYCGSNWDACLL